MWGRERGLAERGGFSLWLASPKITPDHPHTERDRKREVITIPMQTTAHGGHISCFVTHILSPPTNQIKHMGDLTTRQKGNVNLTMQHRNRHIRDSRLLDRQLATAANRTLPWHVLSTVRTLPFHTSLNWSMPTLYLYWQLELQFHPRPWLLSTDGFGDCFLNLQWLHQDS
jgi:hypothetical protein